jgi:hypothetical protein
MGTDAAPRHSDGGYGAGRPERLQRLVSIIHMSESVTALRG